MASKAARALTPATESVAAIGRSDRMRRTPAAEPRRALVRSLARGGDLDAIGVAPQPLEAVEQPRFRSRRCAR